MSIRVGKNLNSALVRSTGMLVALGVLFASCSQHYCPTYASTTYNQSFKYGPEKSLAYKPVKVHEFDKKKMVKSSKKEKSKPTVR